MALIRRRWEQFPVSALSVGPASIIFILPDIWVPSSKRHLAATLRFPSGARALKPFRSFHIEEGGAMEAVFSKRQRLLHTKTYKLKIFLLYNLSLFRLDKVPY